jgi:Tfp pilus assembly major pilin PilA
MKLNVNIDIVDILASIDIKSLEQYIRRRKLEEIQEQGSVTNSTSTMIPMQLTKKIELDFCDDSFDDDLFDISDSNNEDFYYNSIDKNNGCDEIDIDELDDFDDCFSL